jgi:cytochrome o ubiquinol oxidase subunit II
MRHNYKILLPILLTLGIVAATLYLLFTQDIAILQTKGTIADQQRNLLVGTAILSLVVIVPVFVLTFYIAWKYRAGNKKAKYQPNWDGHRGLELTWWAIPLIIISLLAIVTWITSHSLDPYRPLTSDKKPVRVQVVALNWKWLFIYPDYNVASVNYLKFPEDTPVNFTITADAPMNSFWIPQLGGQVYAMSGMSTKLHLMASEPGSYNGSSANISGEGFAGMKFVAEATSEADFTSWIEAARSSHNNLDKTTYEQLAKPSRDNPPGTYKLTEPALYDIVVMKYMSHGGHAGGQQKEGH